MTTAGSVILETARRGELHHAVMLHGPAPDVLRALAMQIAKALNCLRGTAGDDCAACQRIERRLHPDVHFIEVAGERKMISIEQIREIVSEAAMRPYEGRSKVFLIDPAEALSVSGSNALLKTLEEPARDTTFILLTRSPDLLLPTIRSRCQMLYVAGEVKVDQQLAAAIERGLEAFTSKRDTAALLSLAALVAGHDQPSDAMALLAATLTRAAAAPHPSLPPDRLLAAADAMMAAIRSLTVNADGRLVVEGALAALVG